MANNVVIRIKNGLVSGVFLDQPKSEEFDVVVLDEDFQGGQEIKKFNDGVEKFQASSYWIQELHKISDKPRTWALIKQVEE